jgi:hypothetical protein
MAALPEYFTDEYHQTVERLTQRHRRAWIGRGSPGKNTRDAAPLKGAAFMARQSQFPRGAQFYPKSPVGFYRVYGAPYDEVIVKALAVLAEQDSAP